MAVSVFELSPAYSTISGVRDISIPTNILAPASALTDVSQLALDYRYSAYKVPLYDALIKTVKLDRGMRTTFSADYNFVAGSEAAGFPAKRRPDCDSAATFTDWNFCEPHGNNGGNPLLQNIANPLGPDGVPFTLDDGLKPTAASPMCGKGEAGADVGTYSCDPRKVFSNDSPKSPSNLKSVK